MNIKDIIESNVNYMNERELVVDVDTVNYTVSIGQEISNESEYVFLQGQEAVEFINNCLKIEELCEGEISLYDIQLSEAYPYIVLV